MITIPIDHIDTQTDRCIQHMITFSSDLAALLTYANDKIAKLFEYA